MALAIDPVVVVAGADVTGVVPGKAVPDGAPGVVFAPSVAPEAVVP